MDDTHVVLFPGRHSRVIHLIPLGVATHAVPDQHHRVTSHAHVHATNRDGCSGRWWIATHTHTHTTHFSMIGGVGNGDSKASHKSEELSNHVDDFERFGFVLVVVDMCKIVREMQVLLQVYGERWRRGNY